MKTPGKLHKAQLAMLKRQQREPRTGRPHGRPELREVRLYMWRLTVERGINPEIAGQVLLRRYGVQYANELRRWCKAVVSQQLTNKQPTALPS